MFYDLFIPTVAPPLNEDQDGFSPAEHTVNELTLLAVLRNINLF